MRQCHSVLDTCTAYKGNVDPVEKNLLLMLNYSAFRSGDATPGTVTECQNEGWDDGLQLFDVFQHHIDIVIEAKQRSNKLLVVLHDDMNSRSDALVDKLKREELCHLDQIRDGNKFTRVKSD